MSIPAATACWVRRFFSASEPSHHTTASGRVSRATSLTQSRNARLLVGELIASGLGVTSCTPRRKFVRRNSYSTAVQNAIQPPWDSNLRFPFYLQTTKFISRLKSLYSRRLECDQGGAEESRRQRARRACQDRHLPKIGSARRT